MVNIIWEWVKSILIAILIVAIINVFLGTTSVVSTSMNPNLEEGDRLVLYKKAKISRGDIVTFQSNLELTTAEMQRFSFIKRLFLKEGMKKTLIKRVVGLPGDKLEIKEGLVFINDNLYNEKSYLNQQTQGNILIEKIPEGKYFLMGDNREVSLDSRSEEVGLVDEDKIQGVAIFRFYPFTKVKLF